MGRIDEKDASLTDFGLLQPRL